MRGALDEFHIGPIKTTIPLHRRLMDELQFREFSFDIHYLERLVK
jgi:acetyl-CoA carboxylase biotin carboxylase subunit